MADFVQTMKDWQRMCKEKRGMCKDCGLRAAGNECCAVYDGDMDYANVETVVTNWAAKHPEPKYPTWYQFLEQFDILGIEIMTRPDSTTSSTATTYIQRVTTKPKFYRPIPADIAERLGIQPK